MNAFNFLERAPASFAARLAEFPLDAAARRALLALLFVCAFLAISAGVERFRLAAALASAEREEARLQRADANVRTLRTSIEIVARMGAIARRVGEIQGTGAARAREIAQIAAILPRDVWLTSLACDETGVTLKGGASDFEALGRAISRFSEVRAFDAPQLAGSGLHDSERLEGSYVDFELRLRERAR
jgi:Tfp pilus assembly protein PilN